MPTLPPKTYFPLKYDHDIEDRRQKLHVYLQQIMNRVDMRTSPIFRKFIEIDKQIPESVIYSPVKVASITDLSLGGRDFEILLQKGLLFVAMSDMKITTRLDSYITNVSALSFMIFVCIVYYALGYKASNSVGLCYSRRCCLLQI